MLIIPISLLASVDIAEKVDSGTFPSLIVFLFEEFNKCFCHSSKLSNLYKPPDPFNTSLFSIS